MVDSQLIDIHYLAEFEQIQINEIDVNDFVIVSPKEVEVEVEAEQEEELIMINEVEEEEMIETQGMAEQKEQILMFDLPVNASTESVSFLDSEEEEPEILVSKIEDIEVKDAIEVVPITEVTDEGVKRYSLDDYQELEETLSSATANSNVEESLQLEKKTVEEVQTEESEEQEDADPLNTPISKLLRDRTEERRQKLKDFNYKFRNSNNKIDDIEKEPAYKRAGIELEDVDTSDTTISRTSVNTDDDDLDLRSNNSFLHDNVD